MVMNSEIAVGRLVHLQAAAGEDRKLYDALREEARRGEPGYVKIGKFHYLVLDALPPGADAERADPARLVPVAEAAKAVGVSRVYIHKKIREGVLETVRVAGDFLVRRESLDAYLAWRQATRPRPGRPRGTTKRVLESRFKLS